MADDAAGKHARCPACGQVSRVPQPASAAASLAGDPHSHGVPSGYAPSKPSSSVNPFAEMEPPAKPAPYSTQGDSPFGDFGAFQDSGNPYQAPASYGYARPSLPLSSRGKRFAGALIDSFFLMVAAAPGFILFMVAADGNNDEASAVSAVGLALMILGLFAVGVVNWVMITRSGQSIAKRMLGMRIVRVDTGGLPGFVNGVVLRSWVPTLINQACNLFSLIDALWIFNEERRCIHDLIAQTVVIDV